MNLLSPEVVTILMLDTIVLLFAAIALAASVQIAWKWDRDATTPLQYRLEKRAYLVATIIAFIFALKLPLFLFFVHTLDELADILPGAMCAAGVTDATPYGMPLFLVKLANLYLFGLWLVLHRIDTSRVDTPYTKLKFRLYPLLFALLGIETLLEVLHFGHIDPHVIVSCCGTLYSATRGSTLSPFMTMPPAAVAALFYGAYAAVALAWLTRRPLAMALFNLLFIPVAVYSLIALFSTYVYEMPHHHCPFCLLQRDYGYVGYLLYGTLFGGTFLGIAAWVADRLAYPPGRVWMQWSMLLDTLYVVVVSYYPLSYYFTNGVWL
ncbi:hypothetical protein [Hydrogenimonas sp.]